MFKISKLFRGEIKKIFLGPGMFIMAGLFILVLALIPTIFNPSEKSSSLSQIELTTNSVTSTYSSFLDYKNIYENELETTYSDIATLIDYNGDFSQNLIDLGNELYNIRISFAEATNREVINGTNGCFSLHKSLIDKVSEIENLYSAYMNNYFIPLILVDDDLDFKITTELTLLSRLLDGSSSDKTINYYRELNLTLDEYGSVSTIRELLSQTITLNYSSSSLNEQISNLYNSKNEYLENILSNITSLVNLAGTSEEVNASKINRNQIENDSYHYLSTLINLNTALKNSTLLEIAENYSDDYLSKYIGFENFNSYMYQEQLIRTNYYLENNLLDKEISNTLAFNISSSESTNAFDYMYFSLEVVSVLIVAFTVIIGAGMIAKEHSDGTIKLLAIRPYKRSKIIFAKILATIFIGFIFVLIATIISTIAGCIIYGISFPSVLIIFNATHALTLPIWAVFLIYLLSTMIKITIYALLAITISTIFKSYIAAVCVSAGLYIVNIIITFISNGASWLKYNVFSNLDLFKYFGGSFLANSSSNSITNLFFSPVFADTSIWVSIIVIFSVGILLNIITFTVFNKRDIT